jgi:hypothetical protein
MRGLRRLSRLQPIVPRMAFGGIGRFAMACTDRILPVIPGRGDSPRIPTVMVVRPPATGSRSAGHLREGHAGKVTRGRSPGADLPATCGKVTRGRSRGEGHAGKVTRGRSPATGHARHQIDHTNPRGSDYPGCTDSSDYPICTDYPGYRGCNDSNDWPVGALLTGSISRTKTGFPSNRKPLTRPIFPHEI